jgi:hypothetical protein
MLNDPMTEEHLELLGNLRVKEINIDSMNLTRTLLAQVNCLPHSKKFVSGILSDMEEWNNEHYSDYRHLFRRGQEPLIQYYSSSSSFPHKTVLEIEESEC